MRFLYLVFAVFLLFSLATPGYGNVRKHCAKDGYCSSKCSKVDEWSHAMDCKYFCCIPPSWKGK
ncbi:Cygnin [Mesitornis unicolor]|uniref:Cygnin n=1 Tax=Mesitornis unicolor TaxID=54374 RepID=A0A091QZX8_9AVES|nr:Cygnin [Mesitornis unicolor]